MTRHIPPRIGALAILMVAMTLVAPPTGAASHDGEAFVAPLDPPASAQGCGPSVNIPILHTVICVPPPIGHG